MNAAAIARWVFVAFGLIGIVMLALGAILGIWHSPVAGGVAGTGVVFVIASVIMLSLRNRIFDQ